MLKTTERKTESKLYAVRCPECGDLVENKFFPLDNLLSQYVPNPNKKNKVKDMIEFLGIGALYGQLVLPDAPPFLRGETWFFDKPAPFGGRTLPEFTCADTDIPRNILQPINLNIASIVAQFCMVTGFDDIYPMLRLRKELDDVIVNGVEPEPEDIAQWNRYCDSIVRIPGVKDDALLSTDMMRKRVANILSSILAFARDEAKTPGQTHFAPQEMLIGWRYSTENNRKMPYALVIRGGLAGSFDVRECCCDKCRRPLHWEMGAYPQKVIGILGTQAVGKTTYLMALADVIRSLKFERMTITHDSSDPQWKRVEQTGTGLLWRYQNGFPPEKTIAIVGQAPALTFKVQKDKQSEPIMLTLADIPGEVFYDPNLNLPMETVTAIRSLLLASDSLVLMVNSAQLQERTVSGTVSDGLSSKLTKDASKILTSLKDYLPKRPIATAVILTATDKLGDLRKLLELAFDIRTLPPMVYSAEDEKFIYNTEAMETATKAVSEYMDRTFDQFMHNLRNGFVPAGSPVAAFAVSSGTQCAAEYYPRPDNNEDPDGAEKYDVEAAQRYGRICQERYGIASPILWLLACDGLLDKGRSDSVFDSYDPKIRKRILTILSRKES